MSSEGRAPFQAPWSAEKRQAAQRAALAMVACPGSGEEGEPVPLEGPGWPRVRCRACGRVVGAAVAGDRDGRPGLRAGPGMRVTRHKAP